MNNFAPVLIPTLNRYTHLKRCIVSLSKCTDANKTDIFIALDYPLNENHWEGYNRICEFLEEVKGFKTVNIIKRETNFGVRKNLDSASKKILNKYSRIIISEDDNEFSLNFLEFMNKGLEKYELDSSVYAICGYRHLINIPKNYPKNYFYFKGFSAWGYGTWKNKYIEPYYSYEKLTKFIKNKRNVKELKKISKRHYLNVMHSIIKKEGKFGDFTVFLSNIENDKYCIFPTISKVRNHGHDGSGVNCGINKEAVFINQRIDNQKYFEFSPSTSIIEDEYINKQYRKYFNITFKGKIKSIYTKSLFYIKNIGVR